MKDSWLCIHGSKFYEQLKDVDGMNDSRLYAQVVYAMNISRLLMT